LLHVYISNFILLFKINKLNLFKNFPNNIFKKIFLANISNLFNFN